MEVNYKDRKLYIIGCNKYTEILLQEVGKEISIYGIIDINDNYREETFKGYQVYKYIDIKDSMDGFMVDCTNKVHIEERLNFDGFKVYEDYIDWQYFRCIVNKKKVMIFTGLCDIRALANLIRFMDEFRDEYNIFHFLYDVENNTRYSSKILNRLIRICDVYLYSDNGKEVYNFAEHEMPATCRRICVPTIRFFGLWPQINFNHIHYVNKYYVRPANKSDGAFFAGDLEINKRIDLGMTWEEIYREISNTSFYTKEFVEKNFEKSIRQMEYFEGDKELKIVEYIKNNYKKESLFKDYLHCKNIILFEYIKQIADILNLDIDYNNLNDIKKDVHPYTEIPIYPAVAKHLDIEWVNGETKWFVRSYNEPRYVTFKEYVEWYYNYAVATKTMMVNW